MRFTGCGPAVLLLLACGSDPVPPAVIEISATQGTPQTAAVATTLPAELVALVTADGSPAARLQVRWTATSGTLSDSVTVTNVQGRTSVRWTLGAAPGSYTARATIAGGGSAEFHATATPAIEQLFVDGPALPFTSQRHMEARAADFDGDGDLDLIVAREFQTNMLLLNDGTGHFTNASERIPQKTRDSEDIAVADFDGDGDLDIVIVSEDDIANPQIALVHEYYLNDGSAHFTDVSDRIPVRSESNAVVAGDIDRDGGIDLILSNAGREIVLINDGRGFFSDESQQRMPAAEDGTQDVALGDVDRDGDLDLLVGNDTGHPNLLYLNDGSGVFTLAPAGSLPARSAEITRNADFGDVDNDGDIDIYFSNANYNGGNPQDRLLLNDGTGRFTDATATRLPVMTINTFDAEFVDIDRDGDLDIIAAGNRSSRGGFAFMNDSAGRFIEVSDFVMPFVAGQIVVEVEAADFNGDGRTDLLFSGFNAPHRLLLAK